MKEKEIFSIIKKSLKTKKKIDINSSTKNVEEWDSVGHLILLTHLDQKLKGATSKISEIATANSSKKIIRILKKKKLIQ